MNIKRLENLKHEDFIKYRLENENYTYLLVDKVEKGDVCGIKIKANTHPVFGFMPKYTHECVSIDELVKAEEIYIAKFGKNLSSSKSQ